MATNAEILDAINTAIFDLVSTGKGVQEFSIGGRSTRRYSLAELQSLQQYYSGLVNRASRKRVLLADLSAEDS